MFGVRLFQAENSAELAFAHVLALSQGRRMGFRDVFYLQQLLVSIQVCPLIFDKLRWNIRLDP